MLATTVILPLAFSLSEHYLIPFHHGLDHYNLMVMIMIMIYLNNYIHNHNDIANATRDKC